MDFSFNGNKPENVLFNGNIVNKVLCNGVVVWEKSTIKYNVPFTITAIENTQIGISHYGITYTPPILEYSRNGSDWIVWDNKTLSLNASESLYFRGDNPNGIGNSASNHSHFNISGKVNISGNIMSLMHKNDFETNWGVKNYCFYELFYNTNIVDASKLLLPATKLANNCYMDMFSFCHSLVTAPELPATTLATYCYAGMFGSCDSLVTAPELPASTLVSYCYASMFNGCTSLVTAPKLPAATLTDHCYQYMFQSCTSLVTAPDLSATTLVSYCYHYMFAGCKKLNYIKAMFTTKPSDTYTNYWVYDVSSTGTFVKNKNATWNVTGTNAVPSGWTIQNA